jgi:hypothetical protein
LDTGDALLLRLHGEGGITEVGPSVLLIYRYPNGSKKAFVNELAELVSLLHSRAIVVGDINLNILDEDNCAEYLNLMESFGFHACMREPTREENCLDHVFVRGIAEQRVTAELVRESFGITDHAGIMTRIESTGGNHSLGAVCNWRLPKVMGIIDINRFARLVNDLQWENILPENNQEITNDQFNRVGAKLEECRKMAERKGKRKMKGRKPWITMELVEVIQEKESLYNAYKRNRKDKDNV